MRIRTYTKRYKHESEIKRKHSGVRRESCEHATAPCSCRRRQHAGHLRNNRNPQEWDIEAPEFRVTLNPTLNLDVLPFWKDSNNAAWFEGPTSAAEAPSLVAKEVGRHDSGRL